MKPFELNNHQRQFLGLEPVKNSWERVDFPKGFSLYFEGNKIKKVIYNLSPNKYKEYDHDIPTKKRLKIIPLRKGIEKPITFMRVDRYSPAKRKAQFSVEINRNEPNIAPVHLGWVIGEKALNLKKYASTWKDLKSLHELPNRLEELIEELPPNHQQKIQDLKNRERKCTIKKYKCGDFFSVPFDFDLYGKPRRYFFGRHLMNIKQFRTTFNLPERHSWNQLMTVVQLVTLYNYESNSTKQDLQKLKLQPAMNSFYVMDEPFFHGEYPIIGHLDLEPQELDFPMHYQCESWDLDSFSFSWGDIFIANLPPSPLAVEIIKKFSNPNVAAFNFSGVKYGIDPTSKWFSFSPSTYDLKNPRNSKIRAEIFAQIGVPSDIDYDQFAKKFGFRTRQELLSLIC